MAELLIKKIQLKNLREFVSSDEFSRLNDLPISTKRVNSYLRNPNKDMEKPVLYLGFINNQLIVYRSILQDKIILKDGSISMVWLSGVWTHPKFRRNGWASKLLDEVYKDYHGKLMVSNFGTNSGLLFSNHNLFCKFPTIEGQRFYYRLSLREILPTKSDFFGRIKPLLNITDSAMNRILDFRLNCSKKNSNISIIPSIFNDELYNFIKGHSENSLFQRNVGSFKWILDYPWVEQGLEKELDKKYHFTTTAKRFYTRSFTLKTDKIHGFLFYSIRNEVMKVHYIYGDSEENFETLADFILEVILHGKISCVIITDKKLIQMMNKKGGYIFSKIWNKESFIGKELLDTNPEILERKIYMGDGDSVFT